MLCLMNKAPHKGAFFYVLLFGLLFTGPLLAACPSDRIDETVSVVQVFDGDTVRLEDGRRLRFIGIDTPEIDHRGGRSEPYSRAAQRRVEGLLGKGGELRLRFDLERQDHYGRTLAHPYLSDGRSLNGILLREGLASSLIVPPNIWGLECRIKARDEARDAGRGIWSLPSHRLMPLDTPGALKTGYRWIEGRVEGLERSRKGQWLLMGAGVRLYVANEDRDYFKDSDLNGWKGRRLRASGWLHGKPGEWRMRIRHPAQLQLF